MCRTVKGQKLAHIHTHTRNKHKLTVRPDVFFRPRSVFLPASISLSLPLSAGFPFIPTSLPASQSSSTHADEVALEELLLSRVTAAATRHPSPPAAVEEKHHVDVGTRERMREEREER